MMSAFMSSNKNNLFSWLTVLPLFGIVIFGYFLSLALLIFGSLYFYHLLTTIKYTLDNNGFTLLIGDTLHLIDLLFLMAIPILMGLTIFRKILGELPRKTNDNDGETTETNGSYRKDKNDERMHFLDSMIISSLVSIVAVFLLENIFSQHPLNVMKLIGSILLIVSLCFYLLSIKRNDEKNNDIKKVFNSTASNNNEEK
jgi:hypothetical protein